MSLLSDSTYDHNQFLWKHRTDEIVPSCTDTDSGTDLHMLVRAALPAFMQQKDSIRAFGPNIIDKFVQANHDSDLLLFDSPGSPTIREVAANGMSVVFDKAAKCYALTDNIDLTASRMNEAREIYDTYNNLQAENIGKIIHPGKSLSDYIEDVIGTPVADVQKNTTVTTTVQGGVTLYKWIAQRRLGFDQFGVEVAKELGEHMTDATIKEIIMDTISNVVHIDESKRPSKGSLSLKRKRGILKLMAPVLFQMLFLEDGPLHELTTRQYATNQNSQVVRFLKTLAQKEKNIDVFALWVNFAEQNNDYMPAALALHNMATNTNLIIADMRKTMSFAHASALAFHHPEKKILKTNTSDKYNEMFNAYYQEIVNTFDPVTSLTKLVRMYMTRLQSTNMRDVSEKRAIAIRNSMNKTFDRYAPDIVFGICMPRPLKINDGLRALTEWHTTLVEEIFNVISTSDRRTITIDYMTADKKLLIDKMTAATNKFCNAVFPANARPVFKEIFEKINKMLLDRPRTTGTGQRSVSDTAFGKAFGKILNEMSDKQSEYQKQSKLHAKRLFLSGYELFYHLLNDDTTFVDPMAAILKIAFKYGKTSPPNDGRLYYTEMIYPLFNLYFFCQYMYRAHRDENKLKNQLFTRYSFGPDALRSIINVDCAATSDEILLIVNKIVQSFLTNKVECTNMTIDQLWIMCVLLNDIVAYSNGARREDHAEHVSRFIMENTGVLIDHTLDACAK